VALVFVDFAAEVGDVDIDEIGICGVVVTPEVIEDLGPGDDTALVAHEELEEAEFLGAEFDDAAVARCAAAAEVEDKVFDGEFVGVPGLDAAAAECAEAGEEFLEGERLGEVVVGSGVEATDAILNAVEGGEKEDGCVDTVAPESAADFEAVDRGEHDVEDDDVVAAVHRHLEAFLAVVGEVYGVSFLFEDTADKLGEAALVFNEEGVH
jgi:hypothetical protein